jgi:hypothetical protein
MALNLYLAAGGCPLRAVAAGAVCLFRPFAARVACRVPARQPGRDPAGSADRKGLKKQDKPTIRDGPKATSQSIDAARVSRLTRSAMRT